MSWMNENIFKPIGRGFSGKGWYLGDFRGSDADAEFDQSLFTEVEDTLDLLSKESGRIEEDYNRSMDLLGQRSEIERRSSINSFDRQRRNFNQMANKSGLAFSGDINRQMGESKEDLLMNLRANVLDRQQSELNLGRQRDENIFGLKTSMQEAYSTFLAGRRNMKTGDFDFDINDYL